MARKDWAREKVVEKSIECNFDYYGHVYVQQGDAIKLLKAERARARRVVRGLWKERGANRDVWEACDELLRRLQ